MKSIAIFASHNGSGFDALYKASQDKTLDMKISLLISNNKEAKALQKAAQYGIDTFVVNNKLYEDPDSKIFELLQSYHCDLVFLSGYMKKLSPLLTNNFTIINAHPSLLPKYGGSGMYGRYVHEAVIANHENKSGVTIHFVNEDYDEGKIILQKEIDVASNDTPETLEEKIKLLEKEAIVEAFKKLLLSR